VGGVSWFSCRRRNLGLHCDTKCDRPPREASDLSSFGGVKLVFLGWVLRLV
jgi:hypothetical protein